MARLYVGQARGSLNSKPSLLFLEELFGDSSHAFIDPITKKIDKVEYPSLKFPVQCLSSRYGWLLLLSRETSSLFFFNPVTHTRFNLPYRKGCFDAAAFTAPPTSPDCIIYAVEKPCMGRRRICIDVLRFGYSSWSNFTCESKNFATFKQVLPYEGHLYCIDSLGRVGDFDTRAYTWSVLRESKCSILRNSFLVASGGGIFAVMTGSYGALRGLYKLVFDKEKVTLENVKDLGNATFFIGPYGGCSSSTSIDGMENRVILAGNRPGKKFSVYNFTGGDCREEIAVNDNKFGPRYTAVWI